MGFTVLRYFRKDTRTLLEDNREIVGGQDWTAVEEPKNIRGVSRNMKDSFLEGLQAAWTLR